MSPRIARRFQLTTPSTFGFDAFSLMNVRIKVKIVLINLQNTSELFALFTFNDCLSSMDTKSVTIWQYQDSAPEELNIHVGAGWLYSKNFIVVYIHNNDVHWRFRVRPQSYSYLVFVNVRKRLFENSNRQVVKLVYNNVNESTSAVAWKSVNSLIVQIKELQKSNGLVDAQCADVPNM